MVRIPVATLAAVSSVVAALLLSSPAVATPGVVNDPIIGGSGATAGEFPAVVAIKVNNDLCSGTLISPTWVMTAGHCVTASAVDEPDQAHVTSSIEVFFGTTDIGTNPGTKVGAMSSLPDPAFNINALGSHDLGLIELATPVTNVIPTPLNLVAAAAPVGITLTQVGYGATEVGPKGTVGIENVVDKMTESCATVMGGLSDANLLCWSQADGKGKCEGDSGGPSFAMVAGVQTEVGVTSFGDGGSGSACSVYGADTRVDAEAAFIMANVTDLKCARDGSCDASCGSGELPDDPDCSLCKTDSDCTSGAHPVAGDVCYQGSCTPGPTVAGGLGATCTNDASCALDLCAGDGDTSDGSKCIASCTMGDDSTCPTGFDCLSSSTGTGVCWPSSGGGGGCCDASGQGGPTAMLGLIVIAAVVLQRRRSYL